MGGVFDRILRRHYEDDKRQVVGAYNGDATFACTGHSPGGPDNKSFRRELKKIVGTGTRVEFREAGEDNSLKVVSGWPQAARADVGCESQTNPRRTPLPNNELFGYIYLWYRDVKACLNILYAFLREKCTRGGGR